MAALPDPIERPCLPADEVFAHLGIDRTTGYRAIRDGRFPLPVVRVGRLIRVPTGALLRLLMGDGANSEQYPDATDRSDEAPEQDGASPSGPARPDRARQGRHAVHRQPHGSRA